jgi:CBS domain-containing protein
MKEENVGIVPVVEDTTSRKLVGVVTDRDLCLQVIVEDWQPSRVKVEECMTRNPVTCTPDDDLEDAMELMEEHQVRRIPIVEKGGKLVGIIAMADVAASATSSGDKAEVLEEVSKP